MSKKIKPKLSVIRIMAIVLLAIGVIIEVIGFLVDYQGLNHQQDYYFTTVGTDFYSILRFYVAPWSSTFIFLGTTCLIWSLDLKNKSFRLFKFIAVFLMFILSLDITYKTQLSYHQYDFFAEFNSYPFPGLPFDIRIHKLKSFKDQTGQVSTADAAFTLKTLFPEILGEPEPIIRQKVFVPHHYPVKVSVPEEASPPKEEVVTLPEFECFPEDQKNIEILSDGVKLIKELMEPGEETVLYSLGKINEGPCTGGEIFRKTISYANFPSKTYLQTFEGVLTRKEIAGSDLCEEMERSHYIELNDRYIILHKHRKSFTPSELASLIFKDLDSNKLKFVSSEKESLLYPPKEISPEGLQVKLQFLCPVSELEYGAEVMKLPTGIMYNAGSNFSEVGVIVNFNSFHLEPSLYSSDVLNAKVNGYAFTGIVQVDDKELVPLDKFELKVYTWRNKNNPELKQAFEHYKNFFKGNEIEFVKYQDFSQSNPVIFWKDPLSRWQKFTKIYHERLIQSN